LFNALESVAFAFVCSVNSVSGNSKRCFMDGFRQSRVREHGQTEVFSTCTEFHGNSHLLAKICSTWSQDVATQHTVSLGVGNNLDQTGRLVCCHRTSVDAEREGTHVVLNTFSLELLFCFTNPGQFRMGVDNKRNQVVVNLGLLANNTFGNHHTFFTALVCQHRATNQVAGSPDTRNSSRAEFVNDNKTALINFNTAVFSQQTS